MTAPIVRAPGPPDQDARTVLGSWRDDGYLIQLIDTGDRNADIICKPFAEAPRPCGKVTFDADQDRHFIDWNDLGKMVFEEYKRNFLDTKIYYAMAASHRKQATP